VGDVAGYVAATVLRGVRFVQVPTTLLAQVDSSVGGKVGIDHPSGKNLIGAFHQPSAVFVDPDVLRSLPNAEFRNGLAEMVKIAAALDKRYFAKLERAAGRIHKFGSGVLTECIAPAIGLKAAVVEQDEFEAGLRSTLNLGHTIGHAIEAASEFSVPHGAAVAMGLAVEGSIATSLGILPMADYQRLIRLLRKLGLQSTMPHVRDRKKFFGALSLDKKGIGGNAKYVLLNAIGKSVVGVDVPATYLEGVFTRS
jgi:3-dehydroquinate synthase